MAQIQNIHSELEKSRAALLTHLEVKSADRAEDWASKRDSLTEQVKGLTSDYQAARLLDVPEDETRWKARAEAEAKIDREAVNRVETKNGQTLLEATKGMQTAILSGQGKHEAPGFDLGKCIGQQIKAVTRAGMGFDVSYDELYLKPVRPVQIIDFLPSAATTLNAVNYRRGTAASGATTRSEGQTLAELSPTATQVSDPIQAIGCVLHASLEEVEDDGQWQLVLQEMANEVLRELDEQVMIGNGTAPNLRGITTTASPQTEAYATSRINTCLSAKASLRTTERATPGLYVFRPSDWVLISGDMLTAAYSAIDYVNNGLTARLNGVPVIEHEDMTSGVGAILDPSLYAVIYRQGLMVESTNANGTMFNDLTVSFRAYVRAALKTRRLGVRLIDLTA